MTATTFGGVYRRAARLARLAGSRTNRDTGCLAVDESNVSGSGSLSGFFSLEFHPLSFTKQLENRFPNGTSMEEVLDAAFVADKPEALVDQQASDSPGRHCRVLRCARQPGRIPGRFLGDRRRGPRHTRPPVRPAQKLGQCRESLLGSQACQNCFLRYNLRQINRKL